MAAGPRRLRRQDPGGGARARRLPAPRDPRLPAPGRGGGEGHQARHRHRRRDRHEQPRRGPHGPPPRRVRRSPRRDRHAAVHEPRRSRGGPARRARRRRVPPRRPPRRGGRPRRAPRGRGRRRQRGNGRGADRPAPRGGLGDRRLPARPRRDARAYAGGRRCRARGGPAQLPRRPGRGARGRPRRGERSARHQDEARRARRIGAPAARAGRRQRARARLRRRDLGHRHGAGHAGICGPDPHRPERVARGRPCHAPDRRRRDLRRRRRGHRTLGHHAGRRRGPPRRVHDRPLAAGRRDGRLRRPPAGGGQGPGRGPSADLHAARRRAEPRRLRSRPSHLRRDRAAHDRGRGPGGCGAVHGLRRLLRVRGVRQGVPRPRLHRPARARRGDRRGGGSGGPGDRVQPLPSRPQAGVRLRDVQERDHRDADGPPAGADPSLQHDPPAGRRQGAGPHRLRHVHRLARRAGRQPTVLPLLLHVLDQAEPADHGRTPARRRDRPLHGHARRRQEVRRVLRAGSRDGRDLRQGARGEDHREGERRPRPPLRGHRERREARRGRVRPRRPRGRRAAEQHPQALFPEGALSLDEFRYIAEVDEDVRPGLTSIPGVYVAGAASGAKDIAESILHAGATVAQVAARLEQASHEKVEVPA